MIEIKIILIPVIGALIGLITNWIAVKMLFYPRKKIFGIQGVIPKRKKDIAKRIGDVSPMMLPESFDKTLDKIKNMGYIGDKVHSKLINYFKQGVENKIESLDDKEIEDIVMRTARKELNFVVWAGGIVGFLIGCIQALIILM